MKANYNLIKVLKEAVEYLEERGKDHYNWYNTRHCTCGIIARAAINSLEDESNYEGNLFPYTWTYISKLNPEEYKLNKIFCPLTQLTYKEIVHTLLSLGFEVEDFERVEFLKDNLDDVDDVDYTSESSSPYLVRVIEWLNKEISNLEEELRQEVKLKETNTVEVKVKC